VILTVLELCCILIPGIPPNLIFAANGCIVCLGTPLLAGPILSAVRAGSDLGTACTLNLSYTYVPDLKNTAVQDGSHTFLTDGALLRLLMIVQFVFFCPMQCCAICGGAIGYTVCNIPKFGGDDFNRV